MKVFPSLEFTASELHDIASHLTNPAVEKYFISLAYHAGEDICTAQPLTGETDASFLRRIEYVKGGIGLLETLLHIEAPSKGT